MCRTVAFELSSFLASCCTLLAGNFSKSTLPSLMVLDTNSSSLRKNQNMSLCRILAVSGGYFARFTCTCTTLYHSSTLQFPWQKLVNRSNLARTLLDCSLQYSSYLPHMMSRVQFTGRKIPGYILIHAAVATPGYNFFTFLMLW